MNIVAVSAHVFHSSFLVSCSLSLHIFAFNRSLSLGLLSQSRVVDASDAPALESQRMKSSMLSFRNLYTSKRRSRKSLLLRIGCPEWIHISQKHSEILRLDIQRWNRISAPTPHFLCKVEHMQPQHPMYPVRQDPGLHSNKLMAPQPQGPMAQGHLTTTGTHDADLILSQALMMNMHEVPSYYSFHENNTTLEFLIGPITSGQRPTYLPTTNPSGFIARQVAYPPDLYSRRELNVRMVSPTMLIVHFGTSEPISQSASPSHLKTEKSENELRLCGKLWPTSSKTSSLKETRQVPSLSLHSTYDHKCSAMRIAGTVWEKRFSHLLHLETNRCLILLLLICVFLAFPMVFCDKSFCKPVLRLRMARPMCDGRSFASSPFCRLASRGPSLRGFPVWLTMQLATYLARCLTLQDSVPG